MSIISIAKKAIKSGYICDNCLGRQFSQLLTGISNAQRGSILRTVLAMEYDAKPYRADTTNFFGIKLRSANPKKPKSCWVCGNFFKKLDKIANRIVKKISEYEFANFVLGSRPSESQIVAEDKLWKMIGFKWAEPIKSEINRELGKILERKLGKKSNEKCPDIVIFLNLDKGIKIIPNPLYIKGYYKKLIRGLPQTRLLGYKQSVHQIIEKPLLAEAGAISSSFHGAGREDIDVRCLDWRPFVIELKRPKKRKFDLKKVEKKINCRAVRVKDLRYCDKVEVSAVKAIRADKTYIAIIESEKPVDLSVLSGLKGIIEQSTPTRVAHRRAKKIRKRMVKAILWKKIKGKKFKLKIKAEAGLYVKEMITGEGTKPSVAGLLGCGVKILSLDVVKIWPEHQKG
jgi:tRNA pseudouridine synthase 10